MVPREIWTEKDCVISPWLFNIYIRMKWSGSERECIMSRVVFVGRKRAAMALVTYGGEVVLVGVGVCFISV